MKWRLFVESSQAKTYVLPEGWDSREKIAEELGCSEDNVRKLLGAAVKTGAVEYKVFPVWDKVTKRVKSMTAYRKTGD